MLVGLLKTGSAIALLRMLGMAGGFFISVILAREYGAATLGIYGYAAMLLTLVGVFVGGGCATSLMRTASRAFAKSDWAEARGLLRWSSRISLGVGAATLLLGTLVLASLDLDLPWIVALLLSLTLVLDQNSSLRLALLRGIQQPLWGQLPEAAIRPFVILAVLIGMSLMPLSSLTVTHAFFAMLCGSVVSFVMGWTILRFRAPTGLSVVRPADSRRDWLQSSAALATSAFLIMLNTQSDQIVLGLFASPEDLGVYRVAVQIALLGAFAYTSLNFLALQKFAFFQEIEDYKKLEKWAHHAARLTTLSVFVIMIVFILIGSEAISIVFGPEFAGAALPTILLLVAQLANAWFGFSRSLLIASGGERSVLKVTSLTVLLNLVASSLLVPVWGVVGAALAASVSTCSWNLLLWLKCRHETGVDTSVLGLKTRVQIRSST